LTIRLGIIGGGVMGEAILACVLSKQIYSAQEICISDPQPERRDYLSSEYGVQVTDDNALSSVGEVLLLAVKPQVFAKATEGLSGTNVPLVISILAGVTLAQLEVAIASKAIIRAMPNTPAQVGAGVTAIALGTSANQDHRETALRIFTAVGEVVELPESLMDAVTGLSGSGPGYVAVVIEALADGGVAAGLPRVIATKLAVQTVLGTAQLISKSGIHPAELKDRVTSPGGTTIAGIAQMERSGVRSGLIDAVIAATRRAEELGK
jgi:pyrroline-5-carboxylate reductase